ncbi:helix-turn-helix transcriptional regulator [Atlantibacter sp.]|uniref:helix-turn-helix domain-containing protein n=1 Tax=Atlantibacter sp. TaxID=1903473 RepID=UPI0028A83A67|nr:helix-turn-helix transcriptional regulator [Atlantibacter sp.]
MDTLVKTYICTDNYFLYKGIVCSLAERLNCHFVWVSDINQAQYILSEVRQEDVVILLAETNTIDFYFLIKLCKCQCKVIMASHEQNWLLNIMFNFIMINSHFYLSDLLLAIHSKTMHSFYAKYPKLTRQEKKVLFYTYKGHSVSAMSRYLEISEKTIYQHQRNALTKIGMEKPRNVVGLPKNFLEFLFHKHN